MGDWVASELSPLLVNRLSNLVSPVQLGTHLRAKRKREELSAFLRRAKK